MQATQPVPVARQLESLTQQLTTKLVELVDIQSREEELKREIAAIRNLLAGTSLGRRAEQELQAQKSEEDHSH